MEGAYMTFADVKNYIKETNVNHYGFTKFNDGYRLQIWNSKLQVNVNKCENESDYGLATLALCFHNDEATIYRCKNGYANYDDPARYDLNETIEHTPLVQYGWLFE